jgi:hypothetical protein
MTVISTLGCFASLAITEYRAFDTTSETQHLHLRKTNIRSIFSDIRCIRTINKRVEYETIISKAICYNNTTNME